MQSIAAHFGLEDSSELAWAHRVNTPAKLTAAAQDPALHVLVASVQFGSADATPLVADGSNPTELDIPMFLATAQLGGKAVKLDFQSAAAVEPTLAIIRLLKPTIPLILHADVFTLLAPAKREDALEPEQFIRLCQTASSKAVLSLGWSLKRTHDADGRVEDALIQQVSAMVLQRLGPVSYGVEIRGGYTPGYERGAAIILDPLDPLPTPEANRAPNVVDITPRLRRVA
ncbi:MAG: DUF2181 domain-containing protein [Proteobacteria bacterium]|nr:DUF2181 domain-containing protein [Pseudomonadota bacterium]